MAIFYKTVLKEIKGNVLDDVYPHLVGTKHMPTLEERLGDSECLVCKTENPTKKGETKWMLLADETVAVREGGKQYIECLDCGETTHL